MHTADQPNVTEMEWRKKNTTHAYTNTYAILSLHPTTSHPFLVCAALKVALRSPELFSFSAAGDEVEYVKYRVHTMPRFEMAIWSNKGDLRGIVKIGQKGQITAK